MGETRQARGRQLSGTRESGRRATPSGAGGVAAEGCLAPCGSTSEWSDARCVKSRWREQPVSSANSVGRSPNSLAMPG